MWVFYIIQIITPIIGAQIISQELIFYLID